MSSSDTYVSLFVKMFDDQYEIFKKLSFPAIVTMAACVDINVPKIKAAWNIEPTLEEE